MPHAATDIIQTSPMLTSDACDPFPFPSSSNQFEQYKAIPSNSLALAFEPEAISMVLTKAFIAKNDGQSVFRRTFARCLAN